MNRQEMLEFLTTTAASGQPFWGVAASTPGDVAKARKAGASWALVTHGAMLDPKVPASVIGLLPYASANDVVLGLGGLAKEESFPVFAGVFAADQFTLPARLLGEIREAGFHGIQNFPSIGLAEGRYRAFFHESGMDYDREIDMIRKAREMDFFISALVFTPEQAEDMVLAGADMVVFHPGLTADGELRGGSPATLKRFDDIAAAARKRLKNVLLARLAFEWESLDNATETTPHGIQYDHNI